MLKFWIESKREATRLKDIIDHIFIEARPNEKYTDEERVQRIRKVIAERYYEDGE
jgi:hypothetical protein